MAKELRRHAEAERFAFLSDLLYIHQNVALELARTCLAENASFEALLGRGLDEANASSIKYWLECVVPRLGFRRVVAYLRDHAHENWQGVQNARYWLPKFSDLPGYSSDAVASLASL